MLCGFSAQLRTCVYSISTNIRVCEPLNITTNIAGNQTPSTNLEHCFAAAGLEMHNYSRH